MATYDNVITGIGDNMVVYRQMGNVCGILTSKRSRPRVLFAGPRSYYLGLHAAEWHTKAPRASGTATYYVRILPIWSKASDADGSPWKGTPCVQSAQGTTFTFDPYPDGWPCDGYMVYAGTVSGTLYYQGTISALVAATTTGQSPNGGRFNTTFTVGTTWTYNGSTGLLSVQTIGPPAFADCLEVYQVEGSTYARTFLGGGIAYSDGYARIAKTTAAPLLTGGTAAQSTAATWAAVTDASFRMRLGWAESSVDYDSMFDFTGITFAGNAAMGDVATTLQTAIRAARHPVLYCGTGHATLAALKLVTDGSFEIWVDGVQKQVTAVDMSAAANLAGVATIVQAALQAVGGSLAAATCTYDTTATRFIIRANSGTASALKQLSYLFPHSAGTGTNISVMLDGDEHNSAGNTAVLNRLGKGATTAETVAWSTDHFVFTTSAIGNQYRFSYLTIATADVGTNIATTGWTDCIKTSNFSTYVPGTLAKRTVIGDGTAWGNWCEGMKFRIKTEAAEYLIARYFDEDHLLLDTDYSGDGFQGLKGYILIPFDDQYYVSNLGNPFKYEEYVNSANSPSIVPINTPDHDTIRAIRRDGSNIALIMRHTIWQVDGANVGAPQVINNTFGVPNPQAALEYGTGVAMFTGWGFQFLQNGRVHNLDPESKLREIIERLSVNISEYFGEHDNSEGRDFLCWYIGLDSSWKYNTKVVYEPTTGNWWLYNVKDITASAIIRDASDVPHLLVGNSYDTGHSIPAFTFIQGTSYRNDGASQVSAKTKQGKIHSVAAATTTAGYLTCGIAGASAVIATWQAVLTGYFSVTIDDVSYDVGPISFASSTTFALAATAIQTAIRAKTGGSEVVAWSTDKFVITSGTTTNRSNISYLRPYLVAGGTDISGKVWMNGRDGFGTLTYAVTTRTLTLDDFNDAVAALDTTADGEKSVWLYVCDSNFQNGQWARIASNAATTVTVTPNFSTAPVAGWYWYIAGITPSWTKWIDFGSPHHKNKVNGIAITVVPDETETLGNTMSVQGMQGLNTTVRTQKKIALGGSNDPTNMVYLADQPSTQHGIKVLRPSSLYRLTIEDITIGHRPKV